MRRLHLAFPVAAFAACLGHSPTIAEETRYIDDRSSAAAIVASLYNAVNRHEYARAWSYFGDTKPAKDFETFVKGYDSTTQVNVITGNVAFEGAAGSTFYYVPVAIASFGKDGSEKVFAGCYTARLVNPQIQEATFQPLHLEKGSLKPVDQSYEDALPAQCPDAPAPDTADAALVQAQTAFNTTHATCDRHLPGGDPNEAKPDAYEISYHYKSDADSAPERQARLFRFYCSAGAYNESHIYYLYQEDDGLRELQFATPEVDIRYENDDTEGKVEAVNVIGYYAEDQLVNSSYDDATKSISSHSKWRGVGDASSSGLWIFRDGEFTLVKYDVDASYDGEINPETVLDYDTAP